MRYGGESANIHSACLITTYALYFLYNRPTAPQEPSSWREVPTGGISASHCFQPTPYLPLYFPR